MKTRSIAMLVIITAALTYTILTQTCTQAAPPSAAAQWEYGIYQVGEGQHAFEWMDSTQHVYGPNRQAFFEKMGMSNLLNRMSSTYVHTSAPLPPYLVDTAFINQLGQQGWELVEGWGFQKDASHVFTFKRPVK